MKLTYFQKLMLLKAAVLLISGLLTIYIGVSIIRQMYPAINVLTLVLLFLTLWGIGVAENGLETLFKAFLNNGSNDKKE